MDVVQGGLDDADDRSSRVSPLRGFAHAGEIWHQTLMEDFRFMEAARMESGEYEGAGLSTDDLKPMSKIKQLMITNPQGLVNFSSYDQKSATTSTKEEDYVIVTDFRTRRFLTRMSVWPPVSIFAHWLLATRAFQTAMILVIVSNSFLMAIDGELGIEATKTARPILDTLDFFFLSMFMAEICLKWIDNFKMFWQDYWNVFDFIVTTMSLIAPVLDVLTQNTQDDDRLIYIIATVKYIRILRILRSLNVVTRIEKIMIIWAAIARTAKSLLFITLLMFIFFYIFAVIGLQNLANAMVTLFQLFTLDKWYNIILSLGAGLEDMTIPVIFILLWVLLGSFIFRNIFVGVMVTNFQNIRQEFAEDEEISLMDEERLEDMELNVFGLHDDLTKNITGSEDVLIDWEEQVFHDLDLLNLCENLELTPNLWPRDTLFLYYILMESLSWNIDERDILLDYIRFMASSYLIMKAAPHFRPATAAMTRYSFGLFQSERYWNYLLGIARNITASASETFWRNQLMQHTRRTSTTGDVFLGISVGSHRKSLVRWLGTNLPEFLFGPAPRIWVLMQGVTYASADEILRSREIRPALSELEEMNDEGIIVAYAKSSDADTGSQALDMDPIDSLPDFGFVDTLPNTNSMKFDPWAGGCSTPFKYASPVNNWLTNVNPGFPVEDSAMQEANSAKIASLETELAKMKEMFEIILKNHSSTSSLPQFSFATRDDCSALSCRKPSIVTPLPPPPPPPPLPLPPAVTTEVNQKVIKLKTKSELKPMTCCKTQTDSAPIHDVPMHDSDVPVPTLSDVLKGLGSVKLKPVQRSPGGTPFRCKPMSSDSDPAAMIAAALKKRFARIQSPISPSYSDEDEENISDKENTPGNISEDSFTRSPSFFQFGYSMAHKSLKLPESSLILKRKVSDHNFDTAFPRKRKSGGSPANEQTPLFGQHLLKRRVSNSLLKKQGRLSLHEEGN